LHTPKPLGQPAEHHDTARLDEMATKVIIATMVQEHPEEAREVLELLGKLLKLKRNTLRSLLEQLGETRAREVADALMANVEHVSKEKLDDIALRTGEERPSAVALAAKAQIARVAPRDIEALAQAISDDDFSTVVDLIRRRANLDGEEPAVRKDLRRVVQAVADAERSIIIEAARREVREAPSLLRSVEPRPRAILKQAQAAVRDAAGDDDERTLADEIGDVLRRFAAAHAAEI
jgi:hypothetical protein